MSDEAVRQRYRLAEGKGLEPAPNPKPNPGYKKGGPVTMKKTKPPRKSGRGR